MKENVGEKLPSTPEELEQYGNHIVQYSPEYSLCSGCVSCMVMCGLTHEGYTGRGNGRIQVDLDAANAALFTWMFAVLSAVLWEIWEYIVSLFGADPQQVAATGVGDTMQDMSVCTLGGLFTAVSCWKYLRHLGENRRPGLMMRLFAAYYRENIAKR